MRELAALAALVGSGEPGEDRAVATTSRCELLTSFSRATRRAGAVIAALRGAFRHAAALVAAARPRARPTSARRELTELTRDRRRALARSATSTRCSSMILTQARRVTSSDAGLALPGGARRRTACRRTLRFALAQNFSLPNLPFIEFTVPIDHASLAGYAAATGEPLVIADVYLLPDDVSVQAEPQLRRRVRLPHEVDARAAR